MTSYYLDYYNAWAIASGHTVVISFDVDATGIMTVVGASYIVIQENNNGCPAQVREMTANKHFILRQVGCHFTLSQPEYSFKLQ